MRRVLVREKALWRTRVWRGVARSRSYASAATGTEPRLFDKILVANRGEIACRVMRTAKKMGVRTVAVYSDADVNAIHVSMADEAVRLGPAPSAESYLLADAVVSAAKATGAQGIHPGYGFLSENEAFSQSCHANGIEFIGPPGSAIASMGNKSESKRIMEAAGVPVVPGYYGSDQSVKRLKAEADAIGYPVLIKAVHGGGGKGMRTVFKPEEFEAGLQAARREAKSSFGNDDVLVEKFLTRPRHIEMQIFGDKHGNYVHLFERDCSVQRRNQKVLEEAPAPHMTAEQRAHFGETACAAARAVDYVGAGTVEFILDVDTGAFYFMEMNTRLQVEHPVSEMITGEDFVEWQLRVASGYPLPKTQDELHIRGHAIEARIYAENPDGGFLPSTGHLKHMSIPAESAHVRVDTGVAQGDDVSIYYDPMIAKLVVWDANRAEALRRLDTCLADFRVAGPETNIGFCRNVAKHVEFAKGGVDTNFIPTYEKDLLPSGPLTASTSGVPLAVLALVGAEAQRSQTAAATSKDPHSPWVSQQGFAVNQSTAAAREFRFDLGGEEAEVVRAQVQHAAGDAQTASSSNASAVTQSPTYVVTGSSFDPVVVSGTYDAASGSLVAIVDGRHVKATVSIDNESNEVDVWDGNHHYRYTLDVVDHKSGAVSAGSLLAPMPGTVIQVLVKPEQRVAAGDPLVILLAMKMEHTIKAPSSGVVTAVMFEEGQLVSANAVLVKVDVDEEE